MTHATILIINGREKEWNDKAITFEQVVTLAFGTYQNNDRTIYTVTFTRGQNEKPQGSLVAGDFVNVKHKMIFNVTATDKS
ncbi:multiubiquitin domain-containing protein [Mangrovibacterium diazotrophicum]|uniref:Multiubiquitin n=1 Tax=Mangrovibacterium diazotrophicum TaxID=1261403 RepID=A0A419WAS6_9BACT|nr:multiubiquitin domain-containing protein [Mangrovibacterium diazotrophicum]RKD92524.1 multiubiquitin [Mangrovibacterium diazotrophicum]